MIKVAANIVKGLVGRVNRTPGKRNHDNIGWLQKKMIKHQEDQVVKTVRIKSSLISYQRPYELLHTYNELFVLELYKFNSSFRSPVIIDCGSNIGLSVLYFKKLYPDSVIDAFEPDQNNFTLLTRNIQQNKLLRIQAFKAAVWIKNGTISFESKGTEASHIAEPSSDMQKVKAVRLLDVLQAKDKVQFLKIDIEGAEWKVIQDCAGELYKVENMFLEYHGKATETAKLTEIFSILNNAGFSVYIKNAADNLHHPFTEKKTATIYDVQLNLFCYRA